jgi:hypothetical protein
MTTKKPGGTTSGRAAKKGASKKRKGAAAQKTPGRKKAGVFKKPAARAYLRFRGGFGGTAAVEPGREKPAEKEEGSSNLPKSIRDAFVNRVSAWAEGIAEVTPEGVLLKALERPSAGASIAVVLEQTGATEATEAEQLYARAVARAHAVQQELREKAGGFYVTQEVAELVHVSRQAVDRRRKEGTLLAWESVQGNLFPACQFTPDGRIIPGLADVLRVMRPANFWEILAGLVTKSPALEGRSVIEALADANDDDRAHIVEIARTYTAE